MRCSNCGLDLGDTKTREAFICVLVAGDEYIYSYWRCSACGFYTLETYRDRFMGSEDISVDAPIDPDEGKATVDFIRQCPEPNNKHCRCHVHEQFGPHSNYTPPPDNNNQENKSQEETPNRMEPGSVPGSTLIKCPRCSAPTDSLKRFKGMRYVIYLGITFRVCRCTYTACP